MVRFWNSDSWERMWNEFDNVLWRTFGEDWNGTSWISIREKSDESMKEKDGKFVLQLSLPGYLPENVNVDVSGNVLKLTAEPEKEPIYGAETKIEKTYTDKEDLYNLSEAIAEFKNGLLKIEIPKKESVPALKIKVKS